MEGHPPQAEEPRQGQSCQGQEYPAQAAVKPKGGAQDPRRGQQGQAPAQLEEKAGAESVPEFPYGLGGLVVGHPAQHAAEGRQGGPQGDHGQAGEDEDQVEPRQTAELPGQDAEIPFWAPLHRRGGGGLKGHGTSPRFMKNFPLGD